VADPSYPTSIGHSDADSISLLGHDLAGELMGQISFGELAFWLIAGRRPTPGQSRVFEAVLVALADHGLTPSAIATRLTLTGAPESIQGALAAGILGGGSRFLGVTEDCGRFLADALATCGGALPEDEAAWDALATEAVTRQREARKLIPGLGHPVHKVADPRTAVMYRIAGESGLLGPHLKLFDAIGRVHPALLGRTLALNGAGVCGAALADAGFPVGSLRGIALLARTAGLLGHIAEEQRQPIGDAIFANVDRAADYRPSR
jgi:citrate synthase